MIEQYLQKIGVTAPIIYRLFPDIEDDVRNYFEIKKMGDEDYKDEVERLSESIIEKLKNGDSIIQEYLSNPFPIEEETSVQEISPEISAGEEEIELRMEIPDVELQMEVPDESESSTEESLEMSDIPSEDNQTETESEIEETSKGFSVYNAQLTPLLWMKILALSGTDYKYKINPTRTTKNKLYYWIGEDFYLVTTENPLEGDVTSDVHIFSEEDKTLDYVSALVLSRAIANTSKGKSKKAYSLKDLASGVTTDSEEPVTKIAYKLLDESVEDIWKLETIEELQELISLSKKYRCGCGSV